MRVVFLTQFASLYGANRSLLNLIEGLGAFDVKPFVICADHGDLADALLEQNVPTRILYFGQWSASPQSQSGRLHRLWNNVRVLPALLKQLRQWNVDVVYTNSSVTPVGAAASTILRLPHVWHLREFGELDYGLRPDWTPAVHERIIASAEAQIAVSESVCAHHLRGTSRSNAHLIYNGVATHSQFDRLHQRSTWEIRSKGPYTFAFVGIVQSRKRQDVAIRALALVRKRFPNTRLLIVGGAGEAGYWEECQALTRSLGLGEHVDFWGYVADPYRAFFAADAVLICSQNEAMGRVTVEAMSACRPVIGYNHAGTTELIEHEKTGLLYLGGPEELAAAMMRFLQDPGWARQLGSNAWIVARERYSIERYASQVFAVLQSICPRPAPAKAMPAAANLEKQRLPT